MQDMDIIPCKILENCFVARFVGYHSAYQIVYWIEMNLGIKISRLMPTRFKPLRLNLTNLLTLYIVDVRYVNFRNESCVHTHIRKKRREGIYAFSYEPVFFSHFAVKMGKTQGEFVECLPLTFPCRSIRSVCYHSKYPINSYISHFCLTHMIHQKKQFESPFPCYWFSAQPLSVYRT